jgi:hypothetical protein
MVKFNFLDWARALMSKEMPEYVSHVQRVSKIELPVKV